MKLKKITTEGSSLTTEYAGNYVYKNGMLEFFNHAEGIVEHEADGYKYVYQFKDHLGNIRLSYKDADKNGSISASEIIETKDYYPFGLQHEGYNFTVNGRKHNYGFNGIEYEEGLSLNLYEMDLRQYDPAIARWTAIDPITHHWQSTYSAFDGNPVFWADPSGASVEQTENGTTYTEEHAKVEFLNLRNQYGDSGGTDPKKKKKKKKAKRKDVKDMGAGEFYGMAYNGASRTAFLNGNDPYNPTDADIAQNEREKSEAAGQILLFMSGEWVLYKVFQGGAWVYRSALIGRGTKATMSSSKFVKLLQPVDEFDEAVTLFRGTTGSEAGSSSLFLTDNAAVAATYIKNGGQVVSYRVSQYALKFLEQSGSLNLFRGIHKATGKVNNEFQFIGKELVEAMNKLANPLK
ncbi:RHS repeat domain-containing protein [Aquimarina megaterium]|uniref:RHS repeat domain-containing protein n=1 Tax=Aquimarina megaterium TaxID=1443666 RepID=UPI0009444BC2|nr:RHS repeat-associated core domain-containing protein [Aquimarina megaterium]